MVVPGFSFIRWQATLHCNIGMSRDIDLHGTRGKMVQSDQRVDGSKGQGDAARFVCVFNRARDSYQVPLGLHEAGLLEALVTDFYAPDRTPAWLPRFLRNKRHPDLPARLTWSDRVAFLAQYGAMALKRPMQPVFAWVDARLGRSAGRLAKRRAAHLYCYHSYMPPTVPDDRCLIVFVFHPLPDSYRPMLAADYRLYPEVEASFELEADASFDSPMTVPWMRPDAIVCASRVTARSVIAAGAPAERVTVIPYGLPPGDKAVREGVREEGPARFLFVGNGMQRKGIHHLLRAWCSRPRENAELTVVSYDLDPRIAALAAGDASVRVLGYQSRQDLDRLFSRSDVFIMPSLLEGFGLVYVEALAAGCHVIATPNTGVPDLGLSAGAATLVAPGDLAAIDAAICAATERAVAGGFDRQAIAAEGRRWRQADFRRAIGEHAAAVLAWRAGEGPYPTAHAYASEG